MGQFSGKVAIVTGGNSGIGQETAYQLAADGAKVVVAGRDLAKGQATVAQIKAKGGEAIFVQVDITQSASVAALVRQAVDAYGQVNYLVNSAGAVGPVANTVEATEEDFSTVVTTNINGAWHCMKYVIPEMLKVGGGAIVNVASVIGVIAFPGLPAYASSKAGMIMLTKVAALEYAKQNIRVNVIAPGSIRTPMFMDFSGGTPEAEAYMATFHPIGRIGEPPEAASAILWLLSDGASFVTGHVMPVAGGWEVP
jgi:NAD(P)-dependent dehydrogenase (short-subunit alcohol dehydrogenase family)